MSNHKTFQNVTQDIWNCVQQTSMKEDGTVYDPPYPSIKGTATTHKDGATVELTFNFDSASSSVAYTIKHKSFFVPTDKIWEGIQTMINGCSSS